MIYRFRKVTKDLYRGSAPSPLDLKHLKDKYNVKKIVSLDGPIGEKIDRVTKLLDLEHVIIPIDWKTSSVLKLLKYNLKELLLEDGPVFVHCMAGKDRTGLAVALVQCMYLDKSTEDAIEEAKSLGMGVGLDPKYLKLYEKIIKSCKKTDDNNADIVSNQRDYIGDNKDSYLDQSNQSSFAPYLSQTKQYPEGSVYNYINEQSPTRDNYESYKSPKELEEDDAIPQVGVYNNNSGIHGAGPAEPVGGFIF